MLRISLIGCGTGYHFRAEHRDAVDGSSASERKKRAGAEVRRLDKAVRRG
jgi:hypothetical protein